MIVGGSVQNGPEPAILGPESPEDFVQHPEGIPQLEASATIHVYQGMSRRLADHRAKLRNGSEDAGQIDAAALQRPGIDER